MESTRSQTHQSLERGLRVIEATATIGGAATLSEIARKTALPRSTTHHILRALVEFGYLVQDGGARPYRLGPKLFRLTGRTWTKEQLAEIAMPYLDDLSRRTGEGTSLAVLRDGVVTIVAKRESEGPVRVAQAVGDRRPIYCTAVGKALAAWLPEQELEGIIARTVFDRRTPRTIVTAAAFRRELGRIRAAGFTMDNEEHVPGIRCIAMPVRDHSGEVRASLCVVGPTSRIPQRRLTAIHRVLAEVAADLSARIHIVYKEKPFHTVLGVAPEMYDELWTAGKVMYKLEPVVADGGQLIIYAPHVKEISRTWGAALERIGYHVRDYFLSRMESFKDVPRGVLAHSTHVRGVGTFVDGVEKARIEVILATGIPADTCRAVNLGYIDPATIVPESYASREGEGILLVPHAGEVLHRLTSEREGGRA